MDLVRPSKEERDKKAAEKKRYQAAQALLNGNGNGNESGRNGEVVVEEDGPGEEEDAEGEEE
jgi:hypothetical protein